MIKEDQYSNLSANVRDLSIGYFGASTGAAACIEASISSYSDRIYAIVSRGGRPDLAGYDDLNHVKAATLFIIGEKDDKEIITLNKKALKQLKKAKTKDLVIVPKAGHLFDEEPRLMEKVADISLKWFSKNLL